MSSCERWGGCLRSPVRVCPNKVKLPVGMKTFTLEIITPQKVVYKNEVEQISIPAFEGEMGVLPGHIDCLAMLNPGKIRITPFYSDNSEYINVGVHRGKLVIFTIPVGGFAEIHPKNVVIICKTVVAAFNDRIEN
mgnify:CR=1 FL=1